MCLWVKGGGDEREGIGLNKIMSQLCNESSLMHVCANSKRKQKEWISWRLDVGTEKDPKRVSNTNSQIGKRKRVSKQITNTRSKCTNEKAAWIPLWCILWHKFINSMKTVEKLRNIWQINEYRHSTRQLSRMPLWCNNVWVMNSSPNYL